MQDSRLKLTDFNYALPESLIAQMPLEKRDESRLLVADATRGQLKNSHFKNISLELQALFPGAKKILVIRNESKVFPARVRTKKLTGARGEVFFLEVGERQRYRCLLRPKKKLKVGETLFADREGTDVPLFTVESLEPPLVSLVEGKSLTEVFSSFGEMPLPPYIERDPKNVGDLSLFDKERYQTVYSKTLGSAAAPTAGLHFTPATLSECESVGCEFVDVTLHVGLGTFQPVQTEDITQHVMHSEFVTIKPEVVSKIVHYAAQNLPIVFVGTTSLRATEGLFRKAEELKKSPIEIASEGFETQLFLWPKNKEEQILPQFGNALITNFHQPESTLVMLVAALCGYDFWRRMYEHAVAAQFRFLSYGDSSLIKFRE